MNGTKTTPTPGSVRRPGAPRPPGATGAPRAPGVTGAPRAPGSTGAPSNIPRQRRTNQVEQQGFEGSDFASV